MAPTPAESTACRPEPTQQADGTAGPGRGAQTRPVWVHSRLWLGALPRGGAEGGEGDVGSAGTGERVREGLGASDM